MTKKISPIRFYDNQLFPLHRFDIEPPNYGEEEEFLQMLRNGVLENFDTLISNEKIDAVILSDYAKGFWTDDLAQSIIKLEKGKTEKKDLNIGILKITRL